VAANLSDKHVVVMGLGRFDGGVSVSRWLCAQGAHVIVTDQAEPDKLQSSLRQLDGLSIQFDLGAHREHILENCDLLVVNPAVNKSTSEFYQSALRRGVSVTTEINLFLERCPARVIGVTGSMGKSTTTAMIHLSVSAVLKNSAAGRCWLGGNIGKSLLENLPEISVDDLVMLELSSFMLEDTPRIGFSPHVAVVTNLSGNHLDRHDGKLEVYAAAKQNILRFQKSGDLAILNDDDPVVRGWNQLARGRVIHYSTAGKAPLKLKVPGLHNQSNAQAALAVVEALDYQSHMDAVLKALAGFAGLPHRLQLVHTGDSASGKTVRWFNDSKATTPEASITALLAFEPRRVVCIVGGYDKHADMTAFVRQLAQCAGGVIGIGATGQVLVDAVTATGEIPAEHVLYAGTLQNAMGIARQWVTVRATSLDTVLLSPACASWGQFVNYEQRGELFTKLASDSA
jgi:UDP-N-acetylmuramoylalanine--D-glutamate ligase